MCIQDFISSCFGTYSSNGCSVVHSDLNLSVNFTVTFRIGWVDRLKCREVWGPYRTCSSKDWVYNCPNPTKQYMLYFALCAMFKASSKIVRWTQKTWARVGSVQICFINTVKWTTSERWVFCTAAMSDLSSWTSSDYSFLPWRVDKSVIARDMPDLAAQNCGYAPAKRLY